MTKCDKCSSFNIKVLTYLKYHDIFECLNCGYWNFKKLDDCCRTPYQIISQDHKFPTRTRLYYQCIYCGGSMNRLKPLSFKTYGNKCESEFCNYRFEEWRQERQEESNMLVITKKSTNHLFSSYNKYYTYLNSDEWKEKRKLVLQRDNNMCQICKVNKAVDIHHLSYINLYNEPLDDLQALCRNCHTQVHAVRNSK